MTGALIAAAFAAGFFGSTHCIAMCGAIVLLFEGQNSAIGGRTLKRLAYNAGRMLFYVTLGVIAGASGALLMSGFAQGLNVLRIAASILIILLGFNLALDWQALRFPEVAGASLWKRLSPLARHVLPIRSTGAAIGAGFLWGALPCGLVYSAVALAATGGSALSGGGVMFAFWLGTLPALLLAGASAERLNRWKARPQYRRVAGAIMIAFGLIALSVPLLHTGGDGDETHHHSSAMHAQPVVNSSL
ncbi:MAG TPA: sulfite exporter TauE/SafE family protein [Woeseiaceae bacterium]|nr:sulfite exporter TauE/SafE family protein [Woeseiaceae bacterium]